MTVTFNVLDFKTFTREDIKNLMPIGYPIKWDGEVIGKIISVDEINGNVTADVDVKQTARINSHLINSYLGGIRK